MNLRSSLRPSGNWSGQGRKGWTALRISIGDLTEDHIQIRVGGQQGQVAVDMIGCPNIIIVQKSDVIRGSGAHRNVSRGCRSGLGRMQIDCVEFLYDLPCIRRCSVVPDNDLKAQFIALESADALEGFP